MTVLWLILIILQHPISNELACNIPLPASSDNDLTHGPTIAQAVGYSPTAKLAGARQARSHETASKPDVKGSGKRKRIVYSDDDSADSEDTNGDAPAKKHSGHGGRRTGAGNYQQKDLTMLLDLAEKELPLGQQGWKNIHKRYTKWAEVHHRPVREWKALESKFKNVCDLIFSIILSTSSNLFL